MSEERFLELALRSQTKFYHVAIAILWNEQDAADAMQDAMLRGWKRRFTLREEERFEAWMMRILVNCCRDVQRRRMREKGLLEAMAAQARTGPASGDSGAFDALRALPEELRLPALLYYYEGYGQKDIAQILNVTTELVKRRVRQARARMRKMLEEGGDCNG